MVWMPRTHVHLGYEAGKVIGSIIQAMVRGDKYYDREVVTSPAKEIACLIAHHLHSKTIQDPRVAIRNREQAIIEETVFLLLQN